MNDRNDNQGNTSDEDRGTARAARAAQDDLSELVDREAIDEDERTEDEMFELDQTELDELGLTLDDPHQPGQE